MSDNRKKKERKKKDKYFLRIDGQLMQVKEEVYWAYYEVYEHVKWLDRKDTNHNLVHYAALDTTHSTGEEEMPDYLTESVEDAAIRQVMCEMARECVSLLPENERALIEALYFSNSGKGMTERECAEMLGLSKTALHARKEKVFAKLRCLLEK